MLFIDREVCPGKNYARGQGRAVLNVEGTVFTNTDRPKPVNNISFFFFSVRKQGPGYATNQTRKPLRVAVKVEKFRLLPEPIRLNDLQNSFRSRTEKRNNMRKCQPKQWILFIARVHWLLKFRITFTIQSRRCPTYRSREFRQLSQKVTYSVCKSTGLVPQCRSIVVGIYRTGKHFTSLFRSMFL